MMHKTLTPTAVTLPNEVLSKVDFLLIKVYEARRDKEDSRSSDELREEAFSSLGKAFKNDLKAQADALDSARAYLKEALDDLDVVLDGVC